MTHWSLDNASAVVISVSAALGVSMGFAFGGAYSALVGGFVTASLMAAFELMADVPEHGPHQ